MKFLMPVTVTLWDDTFAQTLEFDLDNSEVPKGQMAVTFRIGIAPPHDDDHADRDVVPVGECDPLVEGDAVLEGADISELIDGLVQVASYLVDAYEFAPPGCDFSLRVSRTVLIPHVQVQATVDGNAYLDRPPGLSGHVYLTFNFWCTVEALRAFAAELDAVVKAFDGRGSRLRRNEAAARAALELQRSRDAERVDDLSDFHVNLYWEDLDEPLPDRETALAEQEAWERANDEWLASYLVGGRRTPANGPDDDEADTDNADDGDTGDEESEAGGADESARFAVSPAADAEVEADNADAGEGVGQGATDDVTGDVTGDASAAEALGDTSEVEPSTNDAEPEFAAATGAEAVATPEGAVVDDAANNAATAAAESPVAPSVAESAAAESAAAAVGEGESKADAGSPESPESSSGEVAPTATDSTTDASNPSA